MITLNLLPDVKKDYIKANRTKNMLTTVAIFTSAALIAVTVLMAMYVFGVQKLQISNAQGSIDESIETINNTEDLDKIVTIQNQLESLPSLQDGTVKASRLFTFLSTITPNDISLAVVEVDFDDDSIEIKGSGTDIKSVNTFVDTLKLATYTYADNTDASLAFSSVVLDAIGTDTDESGFAIVLVFDPVIFDPNVEGLKLTVPEITSTRSQTEKPRSLFDSSEAQ